MKEKINWYDYPTGSKFTCEIDRVKVEGRIIYDSGSIFLCQDFIHGNTASNLLGYKKSYSIGTGYFHEGNNYSISRITNLKLERDPKFKPVQYLDIMPADNGDTYTKYVNLCSGNRFLGTIYKDPFHNCQLMSIGSFICFLDHCKGHYYKMYDQLSRLKRIAVVDIYTKCIDMLPPENCLVFKQNYKSTNGSEMTIVGIKTKVAADYYYNLKKK